MTRLGSEFLKTLDFYERPIWGFFALRQLILLLGICICVTLASVSIWLQMPDIFLYPLLILVSAPFIIFGLNIDEKIKDEVRFLLIKQERTYQTDFKKKEYTKHDFQQEKGFSEALQG